MKYLKVRFLLQAFILSGVVTSFLYGTADWGCATDSAGWSARYSHTTGVLNNFIWVIGGHDSSGLKNDVWSSSDGIMWLQETNAASWTARSAHSSVVLNNELWVLGGLDSIGYQCDVWHSSTGGAWTKATANPGWSGRMRHSSVVFNNEMWVLGGYDSTGLRHDIWHSGDGMMWAKATDSASWSARYGHSSVVFNNKMWVIGGYNGINLSDVWYSSDGASWTKATGTPGWTGRYAHTVIADGGKMWLFGGHDSSGWRNDVWHSSDGVDWVKVTSSTAWLPRECHSSTVFDNKIWLMGGYNSDNLSDVWYFVVDTMAPAKPESLLAMGENPSPWNRDSIFEISWKKPSGHNDIAKAFYKISSPPGENYDTTGSWYPYSPQAVFCNKEGVTPFYLWLGDSTGNVDYNNHAVVELRHDGTIPSNCIASSPSTSNSSNFMVSWSKSSDALSGVKGYYVRVKNGTASSWELWLEDYRDTSAIYNGTNQSVYYFEAYAMDSAGNFNFTGIHECSTYVNVIGGDTTAPPPPDSVNAIAGDREVFLYWSKLDGGSNLDLAGYNVYHRKLSSGLYSRINSHIVTGKWFHDKYLFNDTTYDFVVTSVDTAGNESSFSQSVNATPRDTFPPARVKDFHAVILPGGIVRLGWIKSSSYDCAKYNIYCDNACGVINYSVPIASLPNFDTFWISPALTPDTTFAFGLRAEDVSGHEEKNTNVVVKVRTVSDTLELIKARIITPYAGKKISGDRVTIFARLMFGSMLDRVKMVIFQYKSLDSTLWKPIITTGMHHSNPDSIPPYFIHWNISGLSEGIYCLRAVAVDTFNVPDFNPPVVTISIDNRYPDEEEHTWMGKIVEHIKQETVERMSNNVMLMGNESENNLTRIVMPENALEENTTLSCIIRDPGNSPDPLPYLSTGTFRQIWLENGQTVMLGELMSELEISYVDTNLGFEEKDIWLARWNGNDWSPVSFTLDTIANVVYGETDRVGTFFALLGPTVGTEENAKFDKLTMTLEAYPNPFPCLTNISYHVPAKNNVSLKIYDLTGRLVKTLVNGIQDAGYYNVQWDGKTDDDSDVGNGIYFYKLSAGKLCDIKKMVIMR